MASVSIDRMSSTTASAATNTRKPHGNALAQQRRNAEREGDVASRSAPTSRARSARVQRQIDRRRRQAAAHGGNDGQQRRPPASARAPAVISRRISSPTSRKKNASRPSENHAPTVKVSSPPGGPMLNEDSMSSR